MLHHVLTHLLTSTCTQIPVKGRHTQTHSHQSLRGDSRSEMLFVIVCVCGRGKQRGGGGAGRSTVSNGFVLISRRQNAI